MNIWILTLFPDLFEGVKNSPLWRRMAEKKQGTLTVIDLKEEGCGSFRHLDDSPYGGGAGMVMRGEPVFRAFASLPRSYRVLLTPSGTPLNQRKVRSLSAKKELIFLCGHYEGVDQRIAEECDEEISIGDYILSGGEIAAMVVIDSILRLQEGIIRHESTEEESFENGLLEYPQYTRPPLLNGREVPEVLRSGNHEAIRRWRLRESLRKTLLVRPDLLEKREINAEEKKLLQELREELSGEQKIFSDF